MNFVDTKLNPKIFSDDIEMLPTRDGFGRGLVDAGEKDTRVVVLCADLTESTRCHWFKEKFPERFIEVGVAEQNLATLASGLANYGKIPFMTSYATFSPGRNNEQIRTTISLNNLPVKVIGSHAGISVGPDGATHQALEDIALMRVQPNMIVIAPCDAIEAQKAVSVIAFNGSPTYLRLAREATPVVSTADTPFEIGKAIEIFNKNNSNGAVDVGLLTTGTMAYETLMAAKYLSESGIGVSVWHHATIKPLDSQSVITLARKAGAIVTIEEHQIAGGFGSAIAECLAQNHPIPIEFIGMKDCFGESGEAQQLMRHFEIDRDSIVKSAQKAIQRK